MPSSTEHGHALFDFHATEEDEVSLRAGESFVLLESYDDDWWLVNAAGRVGVVPSNYLRLDERPSEASEGDEGGEGTGERHTLPSQASNAVLTIEVPDNNNNKHNNHNNSHGLLGHDSESSLEKEDRHLLFPPPPSESPHRQSDPDALYQSTELQRLKTLREQAAVQIDALRTTVNNLENHGPPTHGKPVATPPHNNSTITNDNNRAHQRNSDLVVYNRPTQPIAEESNALVVRRSASAARKLSTSSSMQQVTLDPSSVEHISRVINDKIEREFAARDQRLLQQMQELVNQSLLQFQRDFALSPKAFSQPASLPSHNAQRGGERGGRGAQRDNRGERDDFFSDLGPDSALTPSAPHRRRPSQQQQQQDSVNQRYSQYNGKIPRIRLPKVNNFTEKEKDKERDRDREKRSNNPLSSRNNIAAAANEENSTLPPILPKSKGMNSNNNNNNRPIKEEYLSMEGVQYAQCRSVVYPSSQDVALLRNRALQQQNARDSLQLRHVFGYDGDANRHGGATKGKNVLWLRDRERRRECESRIAFPAASVVVVADLSSHHQQSFFAAHTDDVTCLAQHPHLSIIASAQLGSEGLILLWNHEQATEGRTVDKADVAELTLSVSVRGINAIDFSGDGKFLLACTMEESRSVYIFDWEKGAQLCSTKVGHIDACLFRFNPLCFSPFDEENSTIGGAQGSAKSAASANNNRGMQPPSGCYTLTSFGGKQVKFWTLKAQYTTPSSIPVPTASENNGRDYRGKQFKVKVLKHFLEGTQGSIGKKGQPNQQDYTSCCFVGVSGGDFDSVKVLLGMSSGAIQIWQQVMDVSHDEFSAAPNWLPRGKLLAVIADAHDAPIVEFDYFTAGERDRGAERDKLFSTDHSGIINVWAIDRNSESPARASKARDKAQRAREIAEEVLPLQHLGGMQLDESFARSLHLDSTGEHAVLGLANNSILSLQIHVPSAAEGEETALQFEMERIMNCHNGKVRRIAVNPAVESVFATICSDRTINLWDADRYANIGTVDLEIPATAVAFSSNGLQLAIGNEKGEFLVLQSSLFRQFINEKMSRTRRKKKAHDTQSNVMCNDWELVDSKIIAQNMAGKQSKKSVEITEIKFNPARDLIAIGCKDSFVHIFTPHGSSYRQVGLCKGHTSYIKNMDFSTDGKILKTNDAAKELLFWDMDSLQRITNPAGFREATWQTHSCIYGWGLQGIFNRWEADKALPVDTEINCVSRSFDGNLVVASGSHTVKSAIKLFTYPCLPENIPQGFGGHTSPVLDLQFVRSEESLKEMHLASAGGNDSCVFLWDVVHR